MLLGWIWESATPLCMGYISNVKFLIANNNIRSVILEIKNDRCKIVKILVFRYQSNYQSDINTDLSNIAIQTMNEIK